MKSKKVLAGICALFFLTASFFSHGAAAEESGNFQISEQNIARDESYEVYKGTHQGQRPVVCYTALAEGNSPVLEQGGQMTCSFTVLEAGFYKLRVTYIPLEATIREIEMGLQINGEIPFFQAEALRLPKEYVFDHNFKKDGNGHDIRPESMVLNESVTCCLYDPAGLYGAYDFFFAQGENTVTLTAVLEPVEIKSVEVFNEEEPLKYEDYLKAYKGMETSDFERVIEAELPNLRSATVISLNMDRSGPAAVPSNPEKLKINTLGGSGWNRPGQYALWTVDTEQAGLYRLQFRYRQNLAQGRQVYRKLTVNGKLPFAEAEQLAFDFGNKWQLSDSIVLYLDKGENKISLETCLGKYEEVKHITERLTRSLSSLYRDIVVITGTNPDLNRDYLLHQEIPGLTESLKEIHKNLTEAEDAMKRLGKGGLSDNAAIIRTLLVQIESFMEDTDTIASRINNFQTNISSFSDFNARLTNQPLELDCFSITSTDKESVLTLPSWHQSLTYMARAFIGSFTQDYASIGTVSGQKSIDVWVNSIPGSIGRDHALLLKQVSDSGFTPQTGIHVNIKLVQQALAPAIFSGRGPDSVVYIPANEPVNIAARGGLEPLDDKEGYEQYQSNFSKGAFEPYTYNGHVYAIPFTEDFPVLFCRTDIFSSLGIKPPKTWDEFYHALSVIQKNNMTVGVPNVQGTQMATNNNIFAMFLYQRGGQYYTENFDKTAFSSESALNAFRQWTDLYKNHSLPVQYDFYQRFRLGDMPMGIENYTMATMLTVAAPEIEGSWKIYPLPGTTEGETVNNTAIATGMCTIMLESAKDKDAAWQFMKWLSGESAQTLFGTGLEALLGPAGRFNPASKEAFGNLPWKSEQATVIQEQWDKVRFIPQIPGGYYIDRNLTNAFRRTVFYNKNYRETLLTYNREINLEIARKRREFGLEE